LELFASKKVTSNDGATARSGVLDADAIDQDFDFYAAEDEMFDQ